MGSGRFSSTMNDFPPSISSIDQLSHILAIFLVMEIWFPTILQKITAANLRFQKSWSLMKASDQCQSKMNCGLRRGVKVVWSKCLQQPGNESGTEQSGEVSEVGQV